MAANALIAFAALLVIGRKIMTPEEKKIMERADFLKNAAIASTTGCLLNTFGATEVSAQSAVATVKPRALTMWDFSWLERRWPGAGYEDWDKALSELRDRGYNAVRIDAYPHLLAEDPTREWTLKEVWSIQNWGSPDLNRVRIQPFLNDFIATCRTYGIKVGLSSWYREDLDNTRMKITSPEKHAEIWLKTIDSIREGGVLDNVMFVDFCNEWPGDLWAPFFTNDPPEQTWGYWHTDASMAWMKEAVERFRLEYPDLLINFSFDNLDVEKYSERDLSFFDFAEHHIWMVKENNAEFYNAIKERSRVAGRPVDIDGLFSNQVYKNLVAEYEGVYRERPDYWKKLLTDKIKLTATHAATARLPLVTSECWGIVDYKDWPLLSWDWVKELCALGTLTAASTGQWIAVATSNFCGPQFHGMWRDIEWHRRLTDAIKSAPINRDLLTDKVVKALT
jgi:hypothetical protein